MKSPTTKVGKLSQAREATTSKEIVLNSHFSPEPAFFFFFFFNFGLPPRQMEVPTLGVRLGLQVLAYATATATPYACISKLAFLCSCPALEILQHLENNYEEVSNIFLLISSY